MFRRIFQMTLLLLILAPGAWTQTTGTIAGTVTDATGALVPNAKVTVTNVATNDTRRTVSSSEGVFDVSGLVDGDYAIKIEAKGFKTWETSGIHVLPGDRKRISGISLSVGAQTEVVEVQGTTAQLQVTDSGDRSSVIDSQQVKSLGLEGRDVTELVRTLPGFANTSGGLSNGTFDTTRTGIVGGSTLGTGTFSAEGTPVGSGAEDLVDDGARVIDPGNNGSATQTIDADMISEVKVTASAYSAEDWHAPVVVEAIGKSGTDAFHGSVYMYYRNSGLNSNSAYFKQHDESRQVAHYEYPGGSIGGPLLIPHTNFNKQKKLVFWAGYEYYNQQIPNTFGGALIQDNLPTASERAGYFGANAPLPSGTPAGSLTNSTNCAALAVYPGIGAQSAGTGRCNAFQWLLTDQSPTFAFGLPVYIGVGSGSSAYANISPYIGPGAQAYLAQTPLPNHTPTAANPYNYVQPVNNFDNGFIAHGRVDYAFSDNTKLYITYNHQNDAWGLPLGQYFTGVNPTVFPAKMEYENRSNTASGHFVKVISPTLIDEAGASFAYVNIPIVYNNTGAISKSTLKFPYNLSGTSSPNMPFLGGLTPFTGGTVLGPPSFGSPDLGGYYSTKMTPSITDTVTKTAGKHSLKIGGNWQLVKNEQLDYGAINGPNGGLNEFGGFFTNLITSFQPPTFGLNLVDANESPLLEFMTDEISVYSEQDSIGQNMAYSQLGGFMQDDWKVTPRFTLNLGLRVDHFSPWTDDSTGGNGIATFTVSNYLADGGANAVSGPLLPGIRTHTQSHDIPLSGRTLPTLFVSPRFGMAYDIFGNGKTVARGGIGAYYYQDSYNTYQTPLGVGDGYKTCSNQTGEYNDPIIGTNYSSLASLSAGKGVVCAKSNAYTAGSFPTPGAADPEDRSLPYTYTYNFTVSQRTYKNSAFDISFQGSQSFDLPESLNLNAVPLGAYFNVTGGYNPVTTPAAIFKITQSSSAVQDAYRPMPNYGAVSVTSHPAWSNYNSMQITWNRFTGPLTYAINYTWSKNLGIQNLTDPVNLHNDYGPLNQDRAQVLNATYGYDVGQLIKKNRVLAILVNAWQIHGITAVQSGPNFQVNVGQNLGLGGTDATCVSSCSAPIAFQTLESVNSTYYLGSPDYTLMPTLTCPSINSGGAAKQYLNPSCFKLPTPGAISAQRYWFPYEKGPMFLSNDLSLSKTFKVTERQSVQFKGTANNWLNHPIPGFDSANSAPEHLTYQVGALPQNAQSTLGFTNTEQAQRILEFDMHYNF